MGNNAQQCLAVQFKWGHFDPILLLFQEMNLLGNNFVREYFNRLNEARILNAAIRCNFIYI
jgi:hypothetical protein